MARFEAFRGTTYNLDLVEANDVVAPPYDVVGPKERAELAARSPYNSIHLEVPEDPDGGDPYAHAKALWTAWHESSVVAVSEAPSLYVYRMTFAGENEARLTTTGVIGALGLDPSHSGEVLPHEETTPKDKSDRLSLLRSTRTNFSPVWGLSLARGLGQCCEALADAATETFRAVDESGAVHELWTVTDSGAVEEVTSLVGSAPVVLADGHHRYETACSYLAETDRSPGAEAILAFVIELSSDQLHVEAIHRLITGVEPEALASHLERAFELLAAPRDAAGLRAAMSERAGLGLLTASGGWVMVPRTAGEDQLDSVLLREALEGLSGTDVTYQHGLEEVAEAVAEKKAVAAVLLRPVSVEQIGDTAHGGRRMPPKSTFFYPKIRTGLVFRELDAV